MAKSSQKAKRPVGRPYAGGRDDVLMVRAPAGLLDRVDRWAAAYPDMTRSRAIRILIALGLDRAPPKKPIDPKD